MRAQALLSILAIGAFLAPSAEADQRRPGSLLVFPYFDNRPGFATLVTVTNTNANAVGGTIDVEFVYRNWDVCTEFNRTRRLTPGDTITVLTSVDDPGVGHMKGFVYAFAKSTVTGQAVAFDHLIGTTRIYSGSEPGACEIEPFVFRSANRMAQGTPTDVDGDGLRDLNGLEYEQVADQLHFPSFRGHVPGAFVSSLVLIDLTGGPQFQAVVDFLVYNDNEEVFSTQYQFQCWRKIDLPDISGVFTESFLLSTNDDPLEGPTIGGEYGWFELDGNVTNSSATSLQDPAILAVLVEPLAPGSFCYGSQLPFGTGLQANGDLLPIGIFGDTIGQ